MGRLSKFNKETLLDVALMVVDKDGKAVTTVDIAAVVGAGIGSLYYRFASREALLPTLQIRSIRWFQIDFLAAAGPFGDLKEALAVAAVVIPRYCRKHPGKARSLTLLHHEEVLVCLEAGGDGLAAYPGDLREAARGFNDEVAAAMVNLTRRHFGSLGPLKLVQIVVQQAAYSLVRPFLGSGAGPTPARLNDMVAAMAFAALAVTNRPGWSKGCG